METGIRGDIKRRNGYGKGYDTEVCKMLSKNYIRKLYIPRDRESKGRGDNGDI